MASVSRKSVPKLRWGVKEKVKQNKKHTYKLTTRNGRYKIYIDGAVMLSFNQIEFLGYYAFKDDHLLYGIDFYLKGNNTIETSYKTKEVWLEILKLLDNEI